MQGNFKFSWISSIWLQLAVFDDIWWIDLLHIVPPIQPPASGKHNIQKAGLVPHSRACPDNRKGFLITQLSLPEKRYWPNHPLRYRLQETRRCPACHRRTPYAESPLPADTSDGAGRGRKRRSPLAGPPAASHAGE